MRILVSGSTGLIGTALVDHLRELGYSVGRLVRGDVREAGDVPWNPGQALAPETLADVDAVVNLAGANVGSRWSAARKQEILDSRV
ncbi:MAG TPA: NAD-dependent epimerase/dehydratase family protein, partial [candidate division Zixibacteria bacterium]|nr:NAD-dependent epimerase/dehydratase family protein [candidate division Zixibacteria bacterium]